jgi:hypothetical protein
VIKEGWSKWRLQTDWSEILATNDWFKMAVKNGGKK